MSKNIRRFKEIAVSEPKKSFESCRSEIIAAIYEVLDNGWYVGGPQVTAFETEFANYLDATCAVGTGSGTDALQLALRACGIKSGDKVATVSHTAVATVAAIELAGAIPVFIDIDPRRFTMDPVHLEHVLHIHAQTSPSNPIKAIIPVHLYGQPANMPEILSITSTYDAVVIEDCAQAHGASINGKKCGTWGDIGAFSFYPTKNLGCIGDGGAITTNDPVLGSRARRLQEYGWRERFISEFPGMNTRLDALQAAILRIKLHHLDKDNQRRNYIAHLYKTSLAKTSLHLPVEFKNVQHAYHQYVIRTSHRNNLRMYLKRHRIGTSILYPQPIHLQPAYKNRIPVDNGALNNTERVCEQILNIPIRPTLSDEDVFYIIDSILNWRG